MNHTMLAATSSGNPFLLVISAVGLLLILGATGKADWWYYSAKVQRLVAVIGDKATKVFLTISGALMIIFGVAGAIMGHS